MKSYYKLAACWLEVLIETCTPCIQGKQYGGSNMLGEEFCSAVAYTDWKLSGTTLPFLRVALCAVQITAPQQQVRNSISKMISKADIDKLKTKKICTDVQTAEALMASAWEATETTGVPLEQFALACGKMQIRLILHLLGKEMKGREQVQYDSMTDIKDKFEADMLQTSHSGKKDAKSTAEPASVKSLADASNPRSIALDVHQHIKIGKHYVACKESMSKVWQLVDVTESSAILVHKPYFTGEERKEVKLSELKTLKEWSKPVPMLVDDSVRASLLPSASATLKSELLKAKAQTSLYEKYFEFLGKAFSQF